jgi:DNA-binding Lrp family transcriptional regulator
MARSIGISTEELLKTLRRWRDQKKLRRIGAIVNHFRVGMGGGAMVVWQVPPERIVEVGQQLARFSEVSHAYQRPARPHWPFTLYTMVHAPDGEIPHDLVRRMSETCGIEQYKLLVTEKELKKVAPTYVVDAAESRKE